MGECGLIHFLQSFRARFSLRVRPNINQVLLCLENRKESKDPASWFPNTLFSSFIKVAGESVVNQKPSQSLYVSVRRIDTAGMVTAWIVRN